MGQHQFECRIQDRPTISEDGPRLRANDGNAIEVDLDLDARKLLDSLYHGIARRHFELIRREGLNPRGRQ